MRADILLESNEMTTGFFGGLNEQANKCQIYNYHENSLKAPIKSHFLDYRKVKYLLVQDICTKRNYIAPPAKPEKKAQKPKKPNTPSQNEELMKQLEAFKTDFQISQEIPLEAPQKKSQKSFQKWNHNEVHQEALEDGPLQGNFD